MKSFILYWLFGIVPLYFFAQAAHATPPQPPRHPFSGWEFISKITVESTNSEQFATLELPSEFFSHLRPDLGDLRIVSEVEVEYVPYALITEQTKDKFTKVPGRIFDLSSSNNTTSFILDLNAAGNFHDEVTLETSSENFRRIVTVEGSNDRSEWRVLQSRGQIFDYTVRDINPVFVKDTRVKYPDATVRYLRVTLYDNGEKPLKIQGAGVGRRVGAQVREIAYHASFSRQENIPDKATELIVDVGVSGTPHHKARITLPAKNFHRAINIYEQNENQEWQLLANGYIFAIDTDRFKGENLIVEYPESRSRMLKISILNRDDQPLAVENIELFGVARSILFPHKHGMSYYAYLDNPDAKPAQYDIAFLSQYIDRGQAARATAAVIERNLNFVQKVISPPPLSERVPYLLPFVLGAVVLILGVLLWRLVQNVKTQNGKSNSLSELESGENQQDPSANSRQNRSAGSK